MDIEFVETHGTYTGRGPGGRTWTIVRAVTGWHLSFRDEGDCTSTFAGVHHSLKAAQAEARR